MKLDIRQVNNGFILKISELLVDPANHTSVSTYVFESLPSMQLFINDLTKKEFKND